MTPPREDVAFSSGTGACRAWIFRPEHPDPHLASCIVMAHGFGLTRDAGLERYAQRFVAAGHVVMAFDYRHFGASSGEPRHLLSVHRQLEDWAHAVDCARSLGGVDPSRVALWGTSLSGGHAVVAAAKDGGVAAVSAQCPMVDALATARRYIRHAGIGAFMKLGGLGVADQLRAVLGMKPVYVPITAPPNHVAALASDDAEAGYAAMTPPHWRNRVCARYALTLSGYRPITYAEALPCPALIQVCMRDDLVSADAAIEAAQKAGAMAQLERYDCGHFDIYSGEHFERASSEQIAFFDRTLSGVT